MGLERGIHYKPTSSRVAALAMIHELCRYLDDCPEIWATAVINQRHLNFATAKKLSFSSGNPGAGLYVNIGKVFDRKSIPGIPVF